MLIAWLGACYAIGAWDTHGMPGFYFYMYTCATGQVISGSIKILANRRRPGMPGQDRGAAAEKAQAAGLPHRHWLPGSPAFIAAYPMEQLLASPLVKLGGLQHGVTKGTMGAESGSFPSGDSMAGGCFAALLAWYTPLGCWGGIAYACLPMFARVFYWFHWVGDVLGGALTAFTASQIILWWNGGVEKMADCTAATFSKALPCFLLFLLFLKKVARWLRPPPPTA